MIKLAAVALLSILAAAPDARAQEAPAASTAPLTSTNVSELTEMFIQSTKTPERTRVLNRLSQVKPVSGQDVSNLFDLFSRFTDEFTRRSVMASLARLEPGSPQLEPLFITYIKQPEPEAQLFGINGAFHLRARDALPLIRSIAGKKFTARAVTETTMMTERNAWWTQYEALSVLAQWEREKSASLIEAKGRESGKVGALLGRYYWKQTLPKLKGWIDSGELIAIERAALAASAPIDDADARATRPQMLEMLRDTKLEDEIRHQLALKIGLSSTDEEAAALVKEHDAAPAGRERLYWAAAAFSSRRPAVIPLLVRYARQTDEPVMRKGATAQLTDMVGAAEAAALIDPEKKK